MAGKRGTQQLIRQVEALRRQNKGSEQVNQPSTRSLLIESEELLRRLPKSQQSPKSHSKAEAADGPNPGSGSWLWVLVAAAAAGLAVGLLLY